MPTCETCGKPISTKRNKKCRACIGYKAWTEHEDSFIKQYYSQYGTQWCAVKLSRSPQKIRDRAHALGVRLTKKAYYRIVHSAAIAKNTGIKHTPEQNEASRQYAIAHLDFFKEQLMKGRLKYQRSKPTKLEQRLSDILKELHLQFETQVPFGTRYLVDALIGNVVIEADGDWWHGHPRFEPLNEQQLKKQEMDRRKDSYFLEKNYKVVRIWECDMTFDNVQKALVEAGVITTNFHYEQMELSDFLSR